MPNGPSAQRWKEHYGRRPEVYTAFALNIRLLHMVPDLLEPSPTGGGSTRDTSTGTWYDDVQPHERYNTSKQQHEPKELDGLRSHGSSNGSSNGASFKIKTELVEDGDDGTALPEPATAIGQEDKVADQAPVTLMYKDDPVDRHGTRQQVQTQAPAASSLRASAPPHPRNLGMAPVKKSQILPVPLPHHRTQPTIVKHNDRHLPFHAQHTHSSHHPKRTSTSLSLTKRGKQRNSTSTLPQKGTQKGTQQDLSPKTQSKHMLIRSPNPAPMPLPSSSKEEFTSERAKTYQQALKAAFQQSVRQLRSEYGLGKSHVAYWLGPRMSVDDARNSIEGLFTSVIEAHPHLCREKLLCVLVDVRGDPRMFEQRVRTLLDSIRGYGKKRGSSSATKISKASSVASRA